MSETPADVIELLRRLAPQALGALLRRYRGFDACEDAVQEALLAAARQWVLEGVPERPLGWLVTVSSRRLVDQMRSERARHEREAAAASLSLPLEWVVPSIDADASALHDDSLALLFLCCHPALSPASQAVLTLRAVGGLTTAEIAQAFFVPVATMAQRISRAKSRIRVSGIGFSPLTAQDVESRLPVVLHVLYLIFNEGYAASFGRTLHRHDLTQDAIRLTRVLHRRLPDDGEVAGLLALMLLTDARRPARAGVDGALIPLAEQNRSRWNRPAIEEGVALVSRALSRAPLGPYQVQAAIAAVHDEAVTADETDWPQILELYRLLVELSPTPAVILNRAVAVAMVQGPAPALAQIDALQRDGRLDRYHRLHAVRAHLLEMEGDLAAAHREYETAARLATSLPEQNFLRGRSDSCAAACRPSPPSGCAIERRR